MSDEGFARFTRALEGAGIDCMVTGGVASAIHGEPVATDDIDLVVALAEAEIPAFVAAFPVSEYRYATPSMIAIECRREVLGRVVIQAPDDLRADLWLVGADPIHAWGMARRQSVTVGPDTISVAPIEYVIVRKLEWVRSGAPARHLEDIRGMLRCSPDAIDAAELGHWIAARGLAREWSALVAS